MQGCFVEKVEGSLTNVIGLPMLELMQFRGRWRHLILKMMLDVHERIEDACQKARRGLMSQSLKPKTIDLKK
ncbi:MAG: hypothetical protein R3A45_13040 [Bdellovibrionota bacterium]